MRSNFWRSLRFSAVASSLILAAWLTPASADVIYNGGAPDQGGQIYSEAPGVVAMSFELTSGETDITGVNWWGGCYPSATSTCGNTSPTFLVDIWSEQRRNSRHGVGFRYSFGRQSNRYGDVD